MVGRAGVRCDAGSYNAGGNYDSCRKCPYGKTTMGPGLGLTLANCVADVGYGVVNNKMGPCPIGELDLN